MASLLAVTACMSPSLSREEHKLARELTSRPVPQWTLDGEIVIGYADHHLYAARTDGSEFRRITRRWDGRHFQPALSPDGRLAHLTNSGGWLDRLFGEYLEYSISIADFDGRAARTNYKVPLEVYGSRPAYLRWSPDGSSLVYRIGDQTVILDGTGAEQQRFFPPAPAEWGRSFWSSGTAAWSNDGQRIALLAGTNKGGGERVISAIRPDGSDPQILFRIIGNVEEVSTPAWSLDDRRIYFAMRRNEDQDAVLYSIGHDGTGLQKLAQLKRGYYFDIEMSPTGDALLLVSRWTLLPNPFRQPLPPGKQPEGTGLYTIRVDGTDLRHIRSGYLNASWSPDGDRIAVIDMDPTGERGTILYTIYPDGAPDRALMGRNERNKLVPGKGTPP